jgi:pSer/pThr/pTyr-binding forkhead associated (FHA) protein
MSTLDAIEARLQTLLEVQLLSIFPGTNHEGKLYQDLAASMHNGLKELDGIHYAPNSYLIITNQSNLARWRSNPSLVTGMAEALQIAGEEAGYSFQSSPTVTTALNADLEADGSYIIATFSEEGVAETHQIQASSQSEISSLAPFNAFIILGGTKIIPLSHSVTNIGRRLDNQVIIDDPRVSRNHAQIRVSKGSYALFDLDSTGGTFINGQRVNRSILHPGDVISLAGVTLIFGQDQPADHAADKGSTKPKPPSLGDQSIDFKSD